MRQFGIGSEGKRRLGVGDRGMPRVAVFEVPECVEQRVHQAPVASAGSIQTQLGAKEVQPAGVDARWDGAWVAQELTHVETRVADQALGVDAEPIRALRPQDIEVMQVTM